MMTADPRRLRALQEAARTPNQIRAQAEPGVFSGAISTIPQSVGAGLAQAQGLVADFAGRAYQPLLDATERVTGVAPANPFFYLRDEADSYAKRTKPDPLSTGTAGQIMFDLSRVMTQVSAGAALSYFTGGTAAAPMLSGALVTGLSTGRATYNEMVEKGVDPSTAANIAYFDALFTGGGVAVPAAIGYQSLAAPLAVTGATASRGAYYAANVGYGVAANVALGVSQRGATHELLEAGGYKTMAQQYAPLDTASLIAEGVLGAAFSALGARAGLPAKGQEVVDAALAARDAKHAAIDTAPGAPADPATAAAHGQSLEKAYEQLVRGESVNVSQTGIANGSFVPHQRDMFVSELAREQYRMELPAEARYMPSQRLLGLPAQQRARLQYDAPELNEYAAQVEQQYGLPPGLINALKNAGERSNSNQTSPAGARGVMQFMPENLRRYGVTDPTDPAQMIDAAGRYLRDTMRQYGGNIDAVIADYNGGPRQAREVLAGRQPRAAETRAYLQRVRQWLGREADSIAAREQAESGVLPLMPAEQARAARAIDAELIALEGERADLLATAGNQEQIGRIAQVRSELDALQSQRQDIDGDASLRQLAKEIQASTPRTSYKEALSQARKQRAAEITDLENRITRLEGAIRENAEADKAAQRLARIAEEETALRANREAIGAPPAVETPVTTAVRSALDDLGMGSAGHSPIDAGRPAGADAATTIPAAAPARAATRTAVPRTVAADDAGSAPRQTAAQQDGAPESGQQARAAETADDPETQAGLAILEEQGDIVVPVEGANGETVNVSLRQAINEADAELNYGRPEAFNAAVACFMRGGM